MRRAALRNFRPLTADADSYSNHFLTSILKLASLSPLEKFHGRFFSDSRKGFDCRNHARSLLRIIMAANEASVFDDSKRGSKFHRRRFKCVTGIQIQPIQISGNLTVEPIPRDCFHNLNIASGSGKFSQFLKLLAHVHPPHVLTILIAAGHDAGECVHEIKHLRICSRQNLH